MEMAVQVKTGDYSIGQVKTFRGMEGMGFNLNLYRDGKKVCFVFDDACGGPYSYEWVDWKEKTEEGIFIDLMKSLPARSLGLGNGEPITVDMDGDIFVNEMFESFMQDKDMKKKCKTKILFILKDNKEGEYYEIKNAIYDTKTKEFLIKKYGDDLKEIINERYI